MKYKLSFKKSWASWFNSCTVSFLQPLFIRNKLILSQSTKPPCNNARMIAKAPSSGLFSSHWFFLRVEKCLQKGLVHHQTGRFKVLGDLEGCETGTCVSFWTDNPKRMEMLKLEAAMVKQRLRWGKRHLYHNNLPAFLVYPSLLSHQHYFSRSIWWNFREEEEPTD